MNWAFLFSSSLKLNRGSSSEGGPELFLTSIAPLIPEYTISSCCMQLCFLFKSTHHKCSLSLNTKVYTLMLHNSRVLLYLLWFITKQQVCSYQSYRRIPFIQWIHFVKNILCIFFLSIWTPCLVPLFIMLPAEYWVRVLFKYWSVYKALTL